MSTLPVLLPVIVVLLVSISASARRCLISEQPSSLAANVNCYIEADNVTIAPLGNLAITLTWANLSNAFSFDAFLWNNGGDPDFYFSSKQTPNKTNYEERSRNLGIRDEQIVKAKAGTNYPSAWGSLYFSIFCESTDQPCLVTLRVLTIGTVTGNRLLCPSTLQPFNGPAEVYPRVAKPLFPPPLSVDCNACSRCVFNARVDLYCVYGQSGYWFGRAENEIVANWATIAGGKNDQLVELKTSQCSGACLGTANCTVDGLIVKPEECDMGTAVTVNSPACIGCKIQPHGRCDTPKNRVESSICYYDECSAGIDACDRSTSTCVDINNGLGYRCDCNTGWTHPSGNTTFCQNINECSSNTTCDFNSSNCRDLPGSFSCDCLVGYHRSPTTPIDRCDPNGTYLDSVNRIAKYGGLTPILVCAFSQPSFPATGWICYPDNVWVFNGTISFDDGEVAFEGPIIIEGNLELSSTSIITMSIGTTINVTGCINANSADIRLLIETQQELLDLAAAVNTTTALLYSSCVSGSFDPIVQFGAGVDLTCLDVQSEPASSPVSLGILLHISDTCVTPTWVIAVAVVGAVLGAALLAAIITVAIPSVRRKVFPFMGRSPQQQLYSANTAELEQR